MLHNSIRTAMRFKDKTWDATSIAVKNNLFIKREKKHYGLKFSGRITKGLLGNSPQEDCMYCRDLPFPPLVY